MSSPLNHRYYILHPLGAGGFGQTFLVEDRYMPSSRRCVLKQLKPLTENPEFYQLIQERFQREAAILEDLGNAHPQIPSLYAYFQEEDLFYLVQEWIEGQTLFEYIRTHGAITESHVKSILNSLLKVLDYIHDRQIVHRDIKPDNIILRASNLEPVLLDFGAVKETMGSALDRTGNLMNSVIIGTPGFMASEQAIGRPTYSSDLYSLGLTAIFALTGKMPQAFSTDPMTGNRCWRSDTPGITPSFANVLDRAIQSQADRRFKSVREMYEALNTSSTPLVARESVLATEPQIPASPQATSESMHPISSSPASTPPAPSTQQTSGISEWGKVLLTSGIIGASILAGFVLSRPSDNATDSTNNTPNLPTQVQIPEVDSRSMPVPVRETPIPTALPQSTSASSPQNESLGWIWLGAVDNTKATFSYGEPMIPTRTQPVTITPSLVPEPGDLVRLKTGVNLRENVPQPPDFRLGDKIKVLRAGEQYRIIRVEAFIDTNSNSPKTRVWAEIK